MTRLIGKLEPTDLDAHRAEGAFEALKQALTEMTPSEVIEQVKAAGLAGRGGAGFPTGLKWQFTRSAPGAPKYVICNFDESEPGTFKDRTMVEGDPFRVIEGAILCGYAIDAAQGYVFVRGEYPEATRVLQAAIDKLYGAGLLGEHILGTDFSFDLAIRRGAGAYICGEETALFEAIEGKQGFPRIKPPFPTTHGVFNKPTSINNVETLAIVPDIVARGGEWLRRWGTEKSTGVKLFCLSGHVKQPGVIEAPFGLTVRELIERYGGGFYGEPLAILMGGAAGGFLPPAHFDTPITNETLNPLKAPVGSGAIMVFNQSVDLLDILKRLARFFVHESCGKCVPCRVGTTQIEKILDKIASGSGTPDDLARLKTLGKTMQQICLCGLGMSAPNAVLSALHHFQNHSVFTALA
jgi:NADH-quinone oxidoreductase subunit F